MLTKLPLMITKEKVVQDVESSPNFSDSLMEAFTEINCQMKASTRLNKNEASSEVTDHFFRIYVSFLLFSA
jgi:hypothetical protein